MIYNFTLTDVSKSIQLLTANGVNGKRATDNKQSPELLNFKLYDSIRQVADDWDELVPEGNRFLRTPFLRSLEQNPPKGMRFCYLGFSLNEQLIGVAVCQILHFNANSSINNLSEEVVDPRCVFKAIGRSLKKSFAKRVDFTVLLCGNVLLTGEHGFYFDPAIANSSSAMKILLEGIEVARNQLSKNGENISFTFYKDFYDSTKEEIAPILNSNGFNQFTVQPNMVLDVREGWGTFADYLADMSSKYRVKAKSVIKKAKSIVQREFSLEEIKAYEKEIYDLYTNIAKNSGFNAVTLHESYFTGLKENLGDNYRLYGHFLEEKLVAFHTTIDDGAEIEAHFLGFDPLLNRSHKIYHNILFEIIRYGIEKQYKKVVFARTALEIKSSVGAEAKEMYCYLKHKSSIHNKFVKNVFDYLNNEEEWTPRHPFKT